MVLMLAGCSNYAEAQTWQYGVLIDHRGAFSWTTSTLTVEDFGLEPIQDFYRKLTTQRLKEGVDPLAATLDYLGGESWELVSQVYNTEYGHTQYTFKRRE